MSTSRGPIADHLVDSGPSSALADEESSSVGQPVVRVAAASADGKFVHQHFGRATHFQVFELQGNRLRFVETREASPACGGPDGHNQSKIERTVELVADCDVVLVAQIGPGATAALARRGVHAFAIQEFIPDAIRALERAVPRFRSSRSATTERAEDEE